MHLSNHTKIALAALTASLSLLVACGSGESIDGYADATASDASIELGLNLGDQQLLDSLTAACKADPSTCAEGGDYTPGTSSTSEDLSSSSGDVVVSSSSASDPVNTSSSSEEGTSSNASTSSSSVAGSSSSTGTSSSTGVSSSSKPSSSSATLSSSSVAPSSSSATPSSSSVAPSSSSASVDGLNIALVSNTVVSIEKSGIYTATYATGQCYNKKADLGGTGTVIIGGTTYTVNGYLPVVIGDSPVTMEITTSSTLTVKCW